MSDTQSAAEALFSTSLPQAQAATPAPAPAPVDPAAAAMFPLSSTPLQPAQSPRPAQPPQPAQTAPQPAQQATQEQEAQQEQADEGEPGDTSFLDQSNPEIELVAPVVRELNLDRGQVEKLVELREQLTRRQASEWHAATMAEFRADPTAISEAKAAVQAWGDAELKAVLNASGLGNHPAVLRFAAKAARASRRR